MGQQNSVLERMRIATPCHVGWERMSGDERVRFCQQCRLHVYNISEMTEAEVVSLISKTEGRFCARLHRRADGSVLTRDCPVGLRALRRRVSKTAGAVLTALIGLCSGVVGQTKSQDKKSCPQPVALKIERKQSKDAQTAIKGVVLDSARAPIPGAKVTLINEQTKEKWTETSDDKGEFSFPHLLPGKYSIEVEVAGFVSHKQVNILVGSGEAIRFELVMQIDTGTTYIGVVSLEGTQQLIETDRGTTIIRRETLERIPHR